MTTPRHLMTQILLNLVLLSSTVTFMLFITYITTCKYYEHLVLKKVSDSPLLTRGMFNCLEKERRSGEMAPNEVYFGLA